MLQDKAGAKKIRPSFHMLRRVCKTTLVASSRGQPEKTPFSPVDRSNKIHARQAFSASTRHKTPFYFMLAKFSNRFPEAP